MAATMTQEIAKRIWLRSSPGPLSASISTTIRVSTATTSVLIPIPHPSASIPRRAISALSGVSLAHVISRCLLWPFAPYEDQSKAEPVAGASAERKIWAVHRGSFAIYGRVRGRTYRDSSVPGQGWVESSLREHSMLASPGEGFGAVACVELAVDVARVGLDRAHGDEEVSGDLRVGPAGGEQAQHLDLALAQWIV